MSLSRAGSGNVVLLYWNLRMLMVHPSYRDLLRDAGLRREADVRRHYAGLPVFSEETGVVIHVGPVGAPPEASPETPPEAPPEVGMGGVPTFYKEYRFARPSWRFWGRASKARREFHNLRRIISFGVACADPVACGERRDWLGRLVGAFIVTRTVADAPPLEQFLPAHCPDPADVGHARLRRTMLEELAAQVARIHRRRFAHNDLHWRNVLVQLDDGGRPRLVWIDCPRGGRFWSMTTGRRKMMKDLATLDRTAVTCCTLRERLRFACRYHRLAGVDMPVRQWVAAVEAYRLRRWREAEAPISPRGRAADAR